MHKCAFNYEWCLRGFFVSSLLSLLTNYRHYWPYKRLPVYLFHTEAGLRRCPPAAPAVEKEMKAKNDADVSPS